MNAPTIAQRSGRVIHARSYEPLPAYLVAPDRACIGMPRMLRAPRRHSPH
jgi:hypothetical protein